MPTNRSLSRRISISVLCIFISFFFTLCNYKMCILCNYVSCTSVFSQFSCSSVPFAFHSHLFHIHFRCIFHLFCYILPIQPNRHDFCYISVSKKRLQFLLHTGGYFMDDANILQSFFFTQINRNPDQEAVYDFESGAHYTYRDLGVRACAPGQLFKTRTENTPQ